MWFAVVSRRRRRHRRLDLRSNAKRAFARRERAETVRSPDRLLRVEHRRPAAVPHQRAAVADLAARLGVERRRRQHHLRLPDRAAARRARSPATIEWTFTSTSSTVCHSRRTRSAGPIGDRREDLVASRGLELRRRFRLRARRGHHAASKPSRSSATPSSSASSAIRSRGMPKVS